MNRKIQEYLENNNATIRFDRGEIEVTYIYGDKGKIETHPSFESMEKHIEYEIYKDSYDIEVEISGRQTGKTTRLCKAVASHVTNGGYAYVYTINNNMGKIIKEKLHEYLGADYIFSCVFFNRGEYAIKTIGWISDELKRVRHFYDEFDFFDCMRDVHLDSKGYYCTTPRIGRSYYQFTQFLRNKYNDRTFDDTEYDIMFRLMDLCKLNYTSYINDFLDPNSTSKEISSAEIFGRIFK